MDLPPGSGARRCHSARSLAPGAESEVDVTLECSVPAPSVDGHPTRLYYCNPSIFRSAHARAADDHDHVFH